MFRRWESSQQPEGKISELKDAIGRRSRRNLIYCSDACLKRYLEARNWNVEKAKKMLKETLMWGSTYKQEEICWVRCNILEIGSNLYQGAFIKASLDTYCSILLTTYFFPLTGQTDQTLVNILII
ncbi:putative CRAL/TRIO domain, CRAL-TRIO lipid binding domain superfamily [Helianthus debilis subsp. tardiflorus]